MSKSMYKQSNDNNLSHQPLKMISIIVTFSSNFQVLGIYNRVSISHRYSSLSRGTSYNDRKNTYIDNEFYG